MKTNYYTLLDIQKAIVLAQRDCDISLQSIRITNAMRSRILQLITDIFRAKYEDAVTLAVATSVVRKGIKKYLGVCGITDALYIDKLSNIFIDQLKSGVPVYCDVIHKWS